MDFTGITYRNQHSSEFGITRVSDGDRYQEVLVPNSSIYTAEVPGGEGVYYFGKNLREKVFSLNFAFDSVTEKQLRDMKGWLSGEELADLVFDETPYKRWVCGVSNSPQINYICFDEYIGDRVERRYKGEVDIEFTSYSPYAFDNYKKSLVEYRCGEVNANTFVKERYLETDKELGNTTVVLEDGYFYTIGEIDTIPKIDIIESYTTGNDTSADMKNIALENGYNIWNDLILKNSKVINIDRNINIPKIVFPVEQEQYHVIATTDEVINIFEFMGKKDSIDLYKNQHYYFSCNFKKASDYNLSIDNILRNDEGEIKKCGLYFRDITNNTFYPFIIPFENEFLNVFSDNGALLTGNTTGPDSLFTNNTNFIDSIINPKYELVAFGIPYQFGAVTGYEGLNISDIKIIKINDDVTISNNTIVPYPGRPNVSYSAAINDIDAKIVVAGNYSNGVSEEKLFGRTVSLKAYTKNLININNNINLYKESNAIIYDNFLQEIIIDNSNYEMVQNKIYFDIPAKLIRENVNYCLKVYTLSEESEEYSQPITIGLYCMEDNKNSVYLCNPLEINWNNQPTVVTSDELNFDGVNIIDNVYKTYIQINIGDLIIKQKKIRIALVESEYKDTNWIPYAETELLPFMQNDFYINNRIKFAHNKCNFFYGNKYFVTNKDVWNYEKNDTDNIAIFSLKKNVDTSRKFVSSHFKYTNKNNGYNHGECFYYKGKIAVSFYKPNVNLSDEELIIIFNKWINKLIKDKLAFYFMPTTGKSHTYPLNNLPIIDSNYKYIIAQGVEGVFNLTAYKANYINVDEWATASGLPEYNSGININDNVISIANYGDIETDWILKIKKDFGKPFNFTISNQETDESFTLNYFSPTNTNSALSSILKNTGGEIIIDTKRNSIVYKVTKAGQAIEQDYRYKNCFSIYFTLEKGKLFKLLPNVINNILIEDAVGTERAIDKIELSGIEYNYLYR